MTYFNKAKDDSKGFEIDGYQGTWKVIDSIEVVAGEKDFLVENNKNERLIINEIYEVVGGLHNNLESYEKEYRSNLGMDECLDPANGLKLEYNYDAFKALVEENTPFQYAMSGDPRRYDDIFKEMHNELGETYIEEYNNAYKEQTKLNCAKEYEGEDLNQMILAVEDFKKKERYKELGKKIENGETVNNAEFKEFAELEEVINNQKMKSYSTPGRDEQVMPVSIARGFER